MIPVDSQPRYQCGFCKRRSTRSVIELHEKRCYRNPNRLCDFCQNKGYTEYFYRQTYGSKKILKREDCPYCKKFDPQQLKEIKERESKK